MPKKILIVDDDKDIVKLIASRLKANGYDVAAAGDGVQAMTAVNTENPDLVILDIRMPAGGD